MQHFLKSGILLAFVFFCGCKNSSSPTSTSSGTLNGNMVGYVVVYDSTITSHDNSGVRISIDGTSYSTESDSNGRWELHNVIPGTYNISFTKDGYATEKMIAYRFVGNGTDYLFSQNIYQVMKLNASLVIRSFTNGTAVFSSRIFGSNPSESRDGTTAIFFGKDTALFPLQPESYLFVKDNLSSGLDSNRGYDIDILSSDLRSAGFNSGEKIYCVAYASNLSIWTWDITKQEMIYTQGYLDIATNKHVYSCFGNNSSEVKTFVLP